MSCNSENSSGVCSLRHEVLTTDVLHLILNKLSTVSDQISFQFVCKHWYNVAQQQKPKKQQLPFLFIPKRFPDQPCLYDLNTHAFVQNTSLQWNHNNIPQRFCGSSFGWLASTDKSNLSFTNPFLSQTLTFPLPPGIAHDLDPDRTVLKAILSKDPTLFPNDYAVVAIHYKSLRLSYFKPSPPGPPGRDARWVEIVHQDELRPFADVIMFKGRVYAVSYFGGLGAFDIDNEELQVIVPNKDEMGYVQIAYLVESSGGKLLQVRRFTDYTKTKRFDVFVLVELDGWVMVKSLGKDALFLGVNDSISVLAANNCESSCIYYTDSYHKRSQGSYIDMGIYNIAGFKHLSTQFWFSEDGQQYPLCLSQLLDKYLPPPIWIQPF